MREGTPVHGLDTNRPNIARGLRLLAWREGQLRRRQGVLHNHGRDEVLSFLGGLDVIPPGLALADAWRAGMASVTDRPPGPAYVLGGVAVKRQGV